MTTNEKDRALQQNRRKAPEKTPARRAKSTSQRDAAPARAASKEAKGRERPAAASRRTERVQQTAATVGTEARPQRKAAPDEQVWKPTREQSRFAEDGAQTERAPRQAKRSRQASADSGYQPYRQANRRKKAARKSAAARFFSSENPLIAGVQSALQKQRENRAKREKKRSAPAVVYTDPVPFNRDRLIVEILTVAAVVLALVLCMSVFFKVQTITVSGSQVYSPWAIREASGINEGDNLLSFGVARASGKIVANLPYVKSVRIGIKLPDTVNIEVKEESVVYAIASSDGIWWLMDSAGKIVEMTTEAGIKGYTRILGVTLDSPKVGEQAVAAEEAAAATDETGTETTAPEETTGADDPLADGLTTVGVTGAEKLLAVQEILAALEDNDIVGEAASVDVTQMQDIVLWYGTRYQVNLGDDSDLEYKIACMNDCVLQLSDYQSGILDVSFRTWPTQVGYTPFG